MTQYQLTLDRETMQRLFGDNEQLRQLLESVVNQVLEAQMSEHLRAEPYERTEERRGYRNGYKPRQFTTRVGTLHLRVPQARDGSFSIPRKPIPRRVHGLAPFVVTRGGEYCFMPSLRGLRWLSELGSRAG